LPVDYGAQGITVFYGSNDGFLRSVASDTGKERWSFIAPEFYPKLKRLKENSPLVKYPSISDATATPKDYFFDGSFGIYQNADNTSIWIYPTMRRGGRVVYALDVTSPDAPRFKWKAGCPNAANDTGCAANYAGVGQTWSTPAVASSLLGYKDATGKYKPALIVGGGYDACEDADVVNPTCTSPKGAAVYIIDADTGALVKSFATLRSVAADVVLLGLASPGVVDHAYAADTGGNLYRIDFDADQTKWVMNRIASTKSGDGRKFLFPPAILPAGNNQVYAAIGSGDREHPLKTNAAYTVVNRFYVIRDDVTRTTALNLDDTSTTGLMCDFSANTTCSPGGIMPTSPKRGWYINLPGTGEQTVTSALIAAGAVTFSTNKPTPASSTPKATCTPDLGVASGYFMNLLDASGVIGVTGLSGGVRSSTFIGGGLPPSPVFATVPVNGKPVSVVIGAIQKSGGASSSIASQVIKPAIASNRKSVYWKSNGLN
jgi:type IV pilus assembly protein PilY1